jgi:Leucine-rich repeat (LRR) protein
MSEADAAYAAAREEILRSKADGATTLSLKADAFRALETIPPEIAALASLQTLSLEGTQVANLAPIPTLSNLQGLLLADTRVTDLAPLHGLANLKTLRLDGTQVADLAPLQSLSALQRLVLSKTRVTDLVPLQSLTNLQMLSLDDTRVADLGPLQSLTGLQTLWLGNTRVKNLAPLQGLSNLQSLQLHKTRVSHLFPLQSLTAMEALWLHGTRVADLSPLRGLGKLRWLELANTRVADLAPLKSLTDLRVLSLHNTQVADLTPLEKLTDLRTLSLNRTQVADLAPLRFLTKLVALRLSNTRMLTDLRPISGQTSLTAGAIEREGYGLHFRGCAACALDPEGLGKLAQIKDDRERTERTLAYLRDLTVWPPVPPDPPEQDDLLRVAPNADGKLDVAPVFPDAVEGAERLKRALYRRLRAAFADLERTTGNQQPEVSHRARAAQAHLAEDFAAADLVEIYVEIAWARAEFDRRGERKGEDRFSNAAVAALDEILTVGPGIVLDNPEVEALEDRRRRFATDPLSMEAAAAQDALAASIAAEPAAFGDTLRDYAAGSLHPALDPTDRRSVVQRLVTRNTVIAFGRWLAIQTAEKGYAAGLGLAALWIVDNQALILAAAAGWGEMFLAWLVPVFDQARAILAAGQASGGLRPLPSRPSRHR